MVPVRDVVLRGDARAARPAPRIPLDGTHADAVRLVVVGDHGDAKRFVADLNVESAATIRHLVAAVPVADVHDLERAVAATQAHCVVLLDPACPSEHLSTVVDVCRRREVPLQVFAATLGDDHVALLGGCERPLFAVHPTTAQPRPYRLKRLLDVTAAGFLLVLLAPFFAVVAGLTKVGSPGPAFYVSWRVGVGEVAFPCYKFRTMVVDADVQQEELESRNEADGCLFKIRDDPRITPTGKFLRTTSLDELPQLLNVLRGEMSLVGPRPLPLRDVARMEHPHRRRHAVLPGLTGLWQVSRRGSLKASDMMNLDLEYIRRWSLSLDLKILLRTVGVVFRGKGAC